MGDERWGMEDEIDYEEEPLEESEAPKNEEKVKVKGPVLVGSKLDLSGKGKRREPDRKEKREEEKKHRHKHRSRKEEHVPPDYLEPVAKEDPANSQEANLRSPREGKSKSSRSGDERYSHDERRREEVRPNPEKKDEANGRGRRWDRTAEDRPKAGEKRRPSERDEKRGRYEVPENGLKDSHPADKRAERGYDRMEDVRQEFQRDDNRREPEGARKERPRQEESRPEYKDHERSFRGKEFEVGDRRKEKHSDRPPYREEERDVRGYREVEKEGRSYREVEKDGRAYREEERALGYRESERRASAREEDRRKGQRDEGRPREAFGEERREGPVVDEKRGRYRDEERREGGPLLDEKRGTYRDEERRTDFRRGEYRDESRWGEERREEHLKDADYKKEAFRDEYKHRKGREEYRGDGKQLEQPGREPSLAEKGRREMNRSPERGVKHHDQKQPFLHHEEQRRSTKERSPAKHHPDKERETDIKEGRKSRRDAENGEETTPRKSRKRSFSPLRKERSARGESYYEERQRSLSRDRASTRGNADDFEFERERRRARKGESEERESKAPPHLETEDRRSRYEPQRSPIRPPILAQGVMNPMFREGNLPPLEKPRGNFMWRGGDFGPRAFPPFSPGFGPPQFGGPPRPFLPRPDFGMPFGPRGAFPEPGFGRWRGPQMEGEMLRPEWERRGAWDRNEPQARPDLAPQSENEREPVRKKTNTSRGVDSQPEAPPQSVPKRQREGATAVTAVRALAAQLEVSRSLAGPELFEEYKKLLPLSVAMKKGATVAEKSAVQPDHDNESDETGDDERLRALGLADELPAGAFEAALELLIGSDSEYTVQESAVGCFLLPTELARIDLGQLSSAEKEERDRVQSGPSLEQESDRKDRVSEQEGIAEEHVGKQEESTELGDHANGRVENGKAGEDDEEIDYDNIQMAPEEEDEGLEGVKEEGFGRVREVASTNGVKFDDNSSDSELDIALGHRMEISRVASASGREDNGGEKLVAKSQGDEDSRGGEAFRQGEGRIEAKSRAVIESKARSTH